jgi:hypothetical protein
MLQKEIEDKKAAEIKVKSDAESLIKEQAKQVNIAYKAKIK